MGVCGTSSTSFLIPRLGLPSVISYFFLLIVVAILVHVLVSFLGTTITKVPTKSTVATGYFSF